MYPIFAIFITLTRVGAWHGWLIGEWEIFFQTKHQHVWMIWHPNIFLHLLTSAILAANCLNKLLHIVCFISLKQRQLQAKSVLHHLPNPQTLIFNSNRKQLHVVYLTDTYSVFLNHLSATFPFDLSVFLNYFSIISRLHFSESFCHPQLPHVLTCHYMS